MAITTQDLDALTPGDILRGKRVIAVTHCQDGLAAVTRIWRQRLNGQTEYVTHTLNKPLGPTATGGGDYTTRFLNAAHNHEERVKRLGGEA